jgi:hypothetical protein
MLNGKPSEETAQLRGGDVLAIGCDPPAIDVPIAKRCNYPPTESTEDAEHSVLKKRRGLGDLRGGEL